MKVAAERSRPDVAARRAEWRGEVMPGLDAGRVVFIDETAARTDMTRTHGYAPRGGRLEGEAPYRRRRTTTFVGAMRAGGFIAPLVVDGAITGEPFEAYARRVLAPELRPGDVAAPDNLACHKRAGAREAIEGAGCTLLLLPAYSPDLNPIEMAFSKPKRLLARRRPAPSRRCGGDRPAAGPLRPGRMCQLHPPRRLPRYTSPQSSRPSATGFIRLKSRRNVYTAWGTMRHARPGYRAGSARPSPLRS